MSRTGRIIWQAFAAWRAHRAPRMAAALAYYTLFSFTPLLVVVTALVGWVIGQETAQAEVLAFFERWLSPREAAFARTALEEALGSDSVSAGLVGFALLLYAASNVMNYLRETMNLIWGVVERPGHSLVHFVSDRLVALSAVVGIGALLLTSVVASATIAALDRFTRAFLPGGALVWHATNVFVIFSLACFALAVVYRVLPNTRVQWRAAWFGAVISAVLLAVGQTLFALYLRVAAIESVYGAAGSLVVFMLWVYYSGQIILFGAECSRAFQASSHLGNQNAERGG